MNSATLHMMTSAPSPVASTSSSASSPPPRPRKRQRTDSVTAEQRREARAERNRQAAQVSRDRRKAQFSALELRVAELEAENEQLKRNANVAPVMRVGASEQERENAELRERIRILESNWANVTQALASQGLTALAPSLLSNPATPSSISSPASLPSPSADSASDPEPTRHLAAGGLTDLKLQVPATEESVDVTSKENDWLAAVIGVSPTTDTYTKSFSSSPADMSLGLWEDDSGAVEMDKLLALLPSVAEPGSPSDLSDDWTTKWTWATDGAATGITF